MPHDLLPYTPLCRTTIALVFFRLFAMDIINLRSDKWAVSGQNTLKYHIIQPLRVDLLCFMYNKYFVCECVEKKSICHRLISIEYHVACGLCRRLDASLPLRKIIFHPVLLLIRFKKVLDVVWIFILRFVLSQSPF